MTTSFDKILGQHRAVDWLLSAYRADRLPHGLIFAGPTGVGKGTTAAALGMLFLCENPGKDKACGKCESCRAMRAGQHPDYHFIQKELIRVHDKTGKSKGSTLSINVIRPELVEKASRKSVLGQGKVFVIDQAELMEPAAQNAMLKTLEEPAGRTLIILLTEAPGVLLRTIHSRCQLVPFAALEEQVVCDELLKRGHEKEISASAARLSGGSIGLAIKWLEDGVVSSATELLARLHRLGEGQAQPDLYPAFKHAADDYADRQLKRDELSSKDQKAREGGAIYLKIATDYFRRRLDGPDSDEIERNCAAIDALIQAERYLDANVSIAIVFQNLAVVLDAVLAGGPSRSAIQA